MKSNRKIYFILLFIMIAFFAIMYFFFGRENVSKEKNYMTIIVNNSSIWNMSNNSWINVSNQKMIRNLYWKEFNVYSNSKKVGKYYLWYDGKWYFFDKDKKAVNYPGNYVATLGSFEADFLEVSGNNIVDYTYVEKVLSDNGLEKPMEYTVSLVYSFDFDNDDSAEQFYFVSNVFSTNTTPDTIFSIVFMVKDNEYKMLYNNISKNTGFNGCKPYMSAIFDIDQDKQYEMILSCGPYSDQTPTDMLYDYDKGEFKILISNQ